MRAIRFRLTAIPVIAAVAAVWAVPGSPLRAADLANRAQLENSAEVHQEIELAPGTDALVQQSFPSFLEYQDLVMFHPKFGYYGTGRVSFSADYQTYPIVLSPYFGQMIAEQIFRMWDGMRQAGTLQPQDRFTVAEFGAGDGALADQILTYVNEKSKADAKWRDFANQVLYICYDRSPALNQTQRKRNAKYGRQFDAREADATNPTATIPAGSLKGVVLSNELPDAFSVQKVILSAKGSAEVAYVAPSLPLKAWTKMKKSAPTAVAEQVEAANQAIQEKLLVKKQPNTVYLSRAAFVTLMESLVSVKNYEDAVQPFEFHEIYLPARVIPELTAHLHRYAHLYADELAKNRRGVVTYINLGEEKFVQGAGRILGAGYVMTIDYGGDWNDILTEDRAHLRTYGPAHQAANDHAEPFENLAENGEPDDIDTSDPYTGPTLNDITTDVNFSLMEAEGALVGLKTVYFGAQKALASGTPINVDVMPEARRGNQELEQEYQSWLKDFKEGDTFKLMVQEKASTDANYRYPAKASEPLALKEKDLNPSQQQAAAEIEQVLTSQ